MREANFERLWRSYNLLRSTPRFAGHTLLTPEDARVAAELLKVIHGAGQPVPAELEALAAKAPARLLR